MRRHKVDECSEDCEYLVKCKNLFLHHLQENFQEKNERMKKGKKREINKKISRFCMKLFRDVNSKEIMKRRMEYFVE